jgi:hypothetical protein
VKAARALGRRLGAGRYLEVRYEELVAEPAHELERICGFAGLEYEPAMLDYPGRVDVSAKPHQQSLKLPATPGLRDWRSEMSGEDAAAFEAIAGDLRSELGYEPRASGGGAGAAAQRLQYAFRVRGWLLAGRAIRRSPIWARRHPPVI